MRISLTTIYVDDQKKALDFYTSKLGFIKKSELQFGEVTWLTVVSPEDQGGVELLLELDTHPAAKAFKAALLAERIPFTTFTVSDIQAEYDRLVALGVAFLREPITAEDITVAIFNDTCGNLIQITAPAPSGE